MIDSKSPKTFRFKQFEIKQDRCTMKVNTDGVLLGAWADVNKSKHILDIGTGTAIIALMVAQRASMAIVEGVEIDEQSAMDATENAAKSPFAERLKIHHTSIQEFAKEGVQFDHIISNPPFFTGGTFSANENKANVRHAIKLPHGDLLHSVTSLLSPRGLFSLILPYMEGLRFLQLAERSGLNLVQKTEVLPRYGRPIERLLISLTKEKVTKPILDSIIILEADNNNYHDNFQQLTKDFYLMF